LGSTPERLWRRRGALLRTEALAGTVASHADDRQAQRLADWLMKDDKNQRENMLVVEDICQRLQGRPARWTSCRRRWCGCVKYSICGAASGPSWRSLTMPAVCISCSPAAVAGLPRRAALDFITRNEPFTRGWYAGSAGYLSLAQSEFCVALRSAKVEQRTLRLYAGAGIVSGSDPEQEWQEIENKAAGLRSLLL
jgi:menaquinone-specific isochorismate synthase